MIKKCPDCKGKKQIKLFTSIVKCELCDGKGYLKKEKDDYTDYTPNWQIVELDEGDTTDINWFEDVDWGSYI